MSKKAAIVSVEPVSLPVPPQREVREGLARWHGSEKTVFVCCLLVYLILAVGTAVTLQPTSDEGELASPSFTLVNRGYMAVTQWEAHRASHKAHSMPPCFFLFLGAWQSIVGFGIIQMRLGSVLWGLVLLLALRYILANLTQDK